MTEMNDGLSLSEKLMTLDQLRQLEDECDAFLTKWKFQEPHQSVASPDALLCIEALLIATKERISNLEDEIDGPKIPF